MLAAARTVCSSSTMGSLSTRCTVAAASTAPRASVLGKSTANSSPPSRATVSMARRDAVEDLRHALQHRVAHGVPEGVIDFLEMVQVEQQQRGVAALPGRLQDDLGRAVEQQRPVRQAGELVVQRQPFQFRLHPHLLAHIRHQSRPSCAQVPAASMIGVMRTSFQIGVPSLR